VSTLAARAPRPADAARQVAERRASGGTTHLGAAAGAIGDRLVSDVATPSVGAEGEGCMEFTRAGRNPRKAQRSPPSILCDRTQRARLKQ
jgi:hypothetical protein